jgi:hypothetical protein
MRRNVDQSTRTIQLPSRLNRSTTASTSIHSYPSSSNRTTWSPSLSSSCCSLMLPMLAPTMPRSTSGRSPPRLKSILMEGRPSGSGGGCSLMLLRAEAYRQSLSRRHVFAHAATSRLLHIGLVPRVPPAQGSLARRRAGGPVACSRRGARRSRGPTHYPGPDTRVRVFAGDGSVAPCRTRAAHPRVSRIRAPSGTPQTRRKRNSKGRYGLIPVGPLLAARPAGC